MTTLPHATLTEQWEHEGWQRRQPDPPADTEQSEQTQCLDYDWDLPHDDDTGNAGDPLTSIAFDVHKHQRSIDTLLEANRAFCDEILTMKRQLHQLAATLEDLQTDAMFNPPDTEPF